jgi:hypothetical protein
MEVKDWLLMLDFYGILIVNKIVGLKKALDLWLE